MLAITLTQAYKDIFHLSTLKFLCFHEGLISSPYSQYYSPIPLSEEEKKLPKLSSTRLKKRPRGPV